VLIATPGRLLDHFQRGRLMLMGVEILVIDEADRMLDMGFIPDIEKICKLLPPKRQTLFFSATMPPEITRLVNTFLTNPQRVEVAKPATTAKTITQRFHFCPEGTDWSKRDALRNLIRADGVRNAIIFANRKVEVAILLKSLLKHGFNAGALHGDMDQKSRMETLDKFRAGEITFLAASDVAARGLDIPDVSHVFNYDLPRDSDDYVHRIGRTGRAGKEGFAASLVTREDLGKSLKDIEKMTGETAVWLGDAPSEDDYANSGKKRGRGGRAPEARGGRDGGRGSEVRSGSREGGRERAPKTSRGESRPQQDAPRQEGSPAERQPGERRDRPQQAPRPRAAQLDQPAERQEARPPRQPQQPRGEQAQQPERRAEQQTRPARPPEDRQNRPPRQEREHRDREPRRNEGRDNRHDGRDQGGPVGFADNIPAFLRRSARPAKVASES
jgi:superfamily II DNA/RNA helicase